MAAMAIDEVAGDGTSAAAAKAAGELDSKRSWLYKFTDDMAIDWAAEMPEWSEQQQQLQTSRISLEVAEHECAAARELTRSAYKKCRRLGVIPRNIREALTVAQTKALRVYIRAARAEAEAVKSRDAVCEGDCRIKLNTMRGLLDEGNRVNQQQSAIVLNLNEKVIQMQTVMDGQDSHVDAISEQLNASQGRERGLEQQLAAVRAELADCKGKQASEIQKRLVAAMAKPVSFEGKIGQGADRVLRRATQSATG